jgi:hypothetical protein
MKNIFKGKAGTVIILIFTVVLAGIAIFTAVRLYQLRQQAVAPNVPSSIPHAQEATTAPTSACSLSFTIESTSTGTPTATPTGTSTATPNPSGTPNSCNGTCGSDSNCQSDKTCYQGFCRNPSCPSQESCACPGTATPASKLSSTPTATPASLPKSGTVWPTFMGAGIGILIIFGSILLAL